MSEFVQWLPAIAGLVLSLVIPFVVNLLAKATYSSEIKRIIAVVFSLLAGVATAVLTGIPTPETLITFALAVVGGVQIAYTAFKAIGITDTWLDALLNLGSKDDIMH